MLIKANDKISKSYDSIIIGSGLAGMTAANKLAKNGRSVLLLEAHFKLGGFATWFNRKGGHVFDVSLHGFPVGMIKTCKKYWSREIADSIIQVKKIRFTNPDYDIESDFTEVDFKNILVEKFEVKREAADNFFETLANMNFYDDREMTNRDLFEKHFPGRQDIVRFLLEPITYANGSTLDDEAITYGIVFSNFMSKGVYTFKGGTDTLIKKMQQELINNGVDIKCNAKVHEIIVEDGTARGVKFNDEAVYSKSVLSNANLIKTIKELVGDEHFEKDYISGVDEVRVNTSSCQVYMGIKEGETIPQMAELIFHSEAKEFSTDALLSKEINSQTFSIYYPEIRPHLNNRYVIVSSSNARYEDWSGLTDEEYEQRKEYLTKRALDVLETLIPGVRDKIDFTEAATPLTMERYTHHLKGASFGTKFEGLDYSMNLHKNINGLFHSGSVGIIMSGWLGAANYGVIQSHEIERYLEDLK
jgi:phytoene dehydrogenase-like protein